MDREAILDDMLRGWDPPPGDEIRKDLLHIMEAFSANQLSRMQRAGVRFWTGGGLLAGTKAKIEVPAGRTQYLPQVRVVSLASKVSAPAVRHELAHAWDHVRTLHHKELRRIDGLSEKELEAALKLKITMFSDSHAVQKMWQHYRKRMDKLLREYSFDLGAREDYSAKSPQEFYAEGYAVFHSNQPSNQARLFLYARELYDFLEKEAKSQGLATPERSVLEKQIKQENLPPPPN